MANSWAGSVKVLLTGTSLLVIAIGVFLFFLYQKVPQSPEDALERFYESSGVAEDQLMDPLILRGRDVVPLLLREIQNKDMHQRRYAIAALGSLRDVRALELLESIFLDPSELGYFRCDALESIALIDPDVARTIVARRSELNLACASEIGEKLLSGMGLEVRRRTYLEALFGWHE